MFSEWCDRKRRPIFCDVAVQQVARRIHVIRGERVMLDADLAELYGVETKRLNEAVRRNPSRFPDDFMFQLTPEEAGPLRSQFATSNMLAAVAVAPCHMHSPSRASRCCRAS